MRNTVNMDMNKENMNVSNMMNVSINSATKQQPLLTSYAPAHDTPSSPHHHRKRLY